MSTSYVMRNKKQVRPSWNYTSDEWSRDSLELLVMMESCRNVMEAVRDAVQSMNRTLLCGNFQAIPRTLYKIEKNTRKRKRKAKP